MMLYTFYFFLLINSVKAMMCPLCLTLGLKGIVI